MDLAQAGSRRDRLRGADFGDGYEASGCALNQCEVQDLFSKYERYGFLYPSKLERLRPHVAAIAENWRRSLDRPKRPMLHDVVVYQDCPTGAWASASGWLTTTRGAHWQHLVSNGHPGASRAVMLSGQAEMAAAGMASIQNWFRAENRFPARVFGTCVASLGEANAVVQRVCCVAMPRAELGAARGRVDVHRCADGDAGLVAGAAGRLCGAVQAEADEWTAGDVELRELDARYREVGLRRYRRVYVAGDGASGVPVGLAVAYRGPLGMNFSFLESRCELWIESGMEPERRGEVAWALLAAAAEAYEDSELPEILVTCDESTRASLVGRGGRVTQAYCRSIWLRAGFEAWHAHVNGFYRRLLARVDGSGHEEGGAA